MGKKNKIDIIIPAYNAHNTIHRTLGSILMQNNKDEVNVIIVNDVSDHDYSEFIEYYSKFFDIKEIKMPVNGGPGVARQYGIDNSDSKYFTCIDADDTFASPFILRECVKQLDDDPKSAMISGVFIEEQELPDGSIRYNPHQQDMVWMFGKIYRRKFIDSHKIRFNKTRANEDNGFNTLIRLCANENEQIKFLGDVVYNWHMNHRSCTRRNDCEYSYKQSFPGYTDNMIYAITEANRANPFNGYIKLFSIEVICNLYEYYIETLARKEEFAEQNFEACKRFYSQVYQKIENEINDEILSQVYNNIMRNTYMGNRMAGIIPKIGIKEFFDKLKNSVKDYEPPKVLEKLPNPIFDDDGKPNYDYDKNEEIYANGSLYELEEKDRKENSDE